ncbi:hypothetical protein K469DRAFT_755630 [Zopfia rhizophila CBS 207.26]|uniref:Uncharacterized protein n=1 Tax=Zopfia rhizophila CBS 207.26 TaxID=1314779 RepID=A0A6A6DEU7_9PEZI|nr:hypothetical protein K469DRAFT_755630 [Zopfia rhizophila CBS 207.26]
MLGRLSTTIVFLTLVGVFVPSACAAPQQSGPLDGESFSLYAYNADYGIGGSPVFYRGGKAFVRNLNNQTARSYTNITFSPSPDDGSAYIINPINPAEPINGKLKLSLNNSLGAYEQVSFSSNPSSLTSKGFMVWGDELFFIENNVPSTKWYVTPKPDEADVYTLRWNSNFVEDGSGQPVALRTIPPVE